MNLINTLLVFGTLISIASGIFTLIQATRAPVRAVQKWRRIALGSFLSALLLSAFFVANLQANINSVSQQNSNQSTPQNSGTNIPIAAQGTLPTDNPQALYAAVMSRKADLEDSLSGNDQYNWNEGTSTETPSGVGSCDFTQGAYHASAFIHHVTECFAEATNFSNFAFQVEMTTIKGDGGGLIFGAGDANSRKYRFYVSTGEYCDLFVIGDTKPIVCNNSSAIKTGLNQTNLLTVIVYGGTIYLYINGHSVADANVEGISVSGKIGMFAFDNINPTEVFFRNVKVWQL